MQVFKCNRLDDLPLLASQILEAIKPQKVVALNGAMGAGKTTLVSALCYQLQVVDHTSSPTFSIVNEYLTQAGETIYHFDFYRINNLREAFDLGFDNYLNSGNYCFIEWPQKIEDLLDLPHINLNIEVNQMQRIITLQQVL